MYSVSDVPVTISKCCEKFKTHLCWLGGPNKPGLLFCNISQVFRNVKCQHLPGGWVALKRIGIYWYGRIGFLSECRSNWLFFCAAHPVDPLSGSSTINNRNGRLVPHPRPTTEWENNMRKWPHISAWPEVLHPKKNDTRPYFVWKLGEYVCQNVYASLCNTFYAE